MSPMLALGLALLSPPIASPPAELPPATPPPASVVLFDDLLLACHRPDVGWFVGDACEVVAGGQTVVAPGEAQRTLPKVARDAQCGAVEGHRAFGERGGGRLWFSTSGKSIACPAEKTPRLSPRERKAIAAAARADLAARPAAWRTYEADRDAAPFTDAFELKSAVTVQGRRFVYVRGFGRRSSALVRLGGGAPQIIARDPYGPVEVVPDRCIDLDGDGRAEVLIAIGGETERSYRLLRFVDDQPSTITALHCGD